MSIKNTAPKIITLVSIKSLLPEIDVFDAIRKGFIAFSQGEAVIPPVGELLFEKPPGDVHIKYGYIKTQPYYVIKIASGFYENAKLGLPSSQGLNLLFDKTNGQLKSVLLDEGHLTDVRTAVAGAVATKALANPNAKKIGIVGSGIQGRMQLEYHQRIMDFDQAFYWNRNEESAIKLAAKMTTENCSVQAVGSLEELCRNCDVIVTTTPATTFLIKKEWIKAGTHITAIGSDTSGKIEIDPALMGKANVVAVDSLSQSQSRGEVYQARKAGLLKEKEAIELGNLLADKNLGRTNNSDITVADLTGVAVQDLMISQAVFEKLEI